ncbi:hypothetical protein Tco_0226445 [Tanacetum coccineum]
METRGRKKVVGEPAPPARDPRDAEAEPNIWDDESVDVNPFGGGKPRYVNRLFQPRRNDHVVDRDDGYHDDPIRSLGLKIEIPEFTGKVHPDDFIDWLSTVERVFDVRDILDKLKVKLVAIKLRQHASLWWDHNMIVENVINEFDKLRMRCDVVEEEEQVVTRFLGVLKPKIADIIKAKSNGSTSHFTPPTRTAPPTTPKTAPKATTPTTSAAGNIKERVVNAPHYKSGDELVYPDRGEVLVIQRVLNVAVSKSVDDNSWIRNNIFRTNWNEDRRPSRTLPVNLVKKRSIVKVIKRCLVQFSIGKSYKDEVCFKKEGVNITLVPFDSRQTHGKGSNLFIKKTGFEGLMKNSPFVFTLVVVKENEIINEAPLQVQPLLREFADVIPDDILPGLPAMRYI